VPIGSTTESGPGDAYGPTVRHRFDFIHQGLSAEEIAARWHIGREEMDRFALRSHERATRAQREGRFDGEILPTETRRARVIDKVAQVGTDEGDPAGDGPLSSDEGVRPDASYERLAALRPAFKEDGRITAGSSSQISDGAAAALIMSEERAGRLGLRPRARFHTFAVAANDPVIMLTAVIPATTLVLEKAKLSIDDMDVIEINEAFASVVLAWEQEHHPDPERVNPNGGAIAIGHPTGASGARLLATLLGELERTGGRYGLQTMCEGGGQANATIIERLG
jgi:acetyl-CoA acetyltransferase family protein